MALFLDELDVIEVKDEADAASYRSLTARAAVLKRRDGDELSEKRAVGVIEARLRARVPTGLSSSEAERQGREAVAQGLAQAGPDGQVGQGCGFGRARLRRARFGGDDRAALVAALACFPVDGAASPLRALAPRLLSEALAALACPLMDASEAFVAGVEAHDPTAHADDRRAFAAARAAVEAAAREVSAARAATTPSWPRSSPCSRRGRARACRLPLICCMRSRRGRTLRPMGCSRGGCGRRLLLVVILGVVCVKFVSLQFTRSRARIARHFNGLSSTLCSPSPGASIARFGASLQRATRATLSIFERREE